MSDTKKLNTEFLRETHIFSALRDDSEALSHLADYLHAEQFGEGVRIIQEGTPGSELYILIEGQASIFKRTVDGDLYKVAALEGKNCPTFGEGGLIFTQPRSATIVADTECKCLVLKQDDLTHFSEKMPHAALVIFRRINERLLERLRKTSDDLLIYHKALMDEIRGAN